MARVRMSEGNLINTSSSHGLLFMRAFTAMVAVHLTLEELFLLSLMDLLPLMGSVLIMLVYV